MASTAPYVHPAMNSIQTFCNPHAPFTLLHSDLGLSKVIRQWWLLQVVKSCFMTMCGTQLLERSAAGLSQTRMKRTNITNGSAQHWVRR